MPVQSGLDVLSKTGFGGLRGRRLGLLTHPAAVNGQLVHLVDLTREARLDIRMLLGPEHGISGTAQDMEPVETEPSHGPAGIPVVSLYGNKAEDLSPSVDALTDIDLLVVDLQDVGTRYYTYAATMLYCQKACARAGVEMMVLDRPNPINGMALEGPLLDDDLRSFVGEFPVPVRHGLTMGELAILGSEITGMSGLSVIKMEGWRRSMWFDQTGLPWVMPSPNMPTLDTATVYPGTCLLESTNLSEGRGTSRPFELLGAPWLNSFALARTLTASSVAGARFRPVTFSPAFHKYGGVCCHGVQVHIEGRDRFEPFFCGLTVLKAARDQDQDRFGWRSEPYEFVSNRPAIDLLCGTSAVRRALEDGDDPTQLTGVWSHQVDEFKQRREAFLLYQGERQ